MKEKNIINFRTVMDHVTISWSEQKKAEYEEMRFLSRDIFGLLEMYNKDNNTSYNSNDKIIIIEFISSEIGYENNINKVVKHFIDYFSDYIIVSAVSPSIYSIGDADEAFRHIENVDGINCKRYLISNYGNVKDDITMSDVPVIKTEDGPRVGLECTEDGEIRFFSIPYLMVRTFNSVNPSDTWFEEYERLCKQFDSFGFISINNYCQFEYACAYIYPNKLGKIVIDQVEKIVGDSNENNN